MTRYDLLDDMIDSILVHDIKCQEKNGVIELSKGNALSTYCNFGSAKYKESYRWLFYVCFHLKIESFGKSIGLNNQSIPVSVDNSLENKDIQSRENIVARASSYYQKIGINITNLKKYCDSDQEFEDLVLHGLINYLIPVSFGRAYTKKYKSSNEPHKYDDITEQFENAIVMFKNYLLQFRTKKMIRSYGGDMPYISDSRYPLGLCNYAVPMNSTEVGGYFSFTRLSPAYFCLPVKTQEYRKRFEEQLKKEALESDFERIVKGFLKYPFGSTSTLEDFTAKMTFEEDDPSEQLFPISDIQVSHALDFNHFYYLTFLDEKVIKTAYPDAANHSDLEKAIKKKAEDDLTRYRKKCLNHYYTDTVHYIEDVLSKIQQIDLTEMNADAPKDEEKCRAALKCFSIDPEYVFIIIKKYRADVCWYSYHLLKNAFREFAGFFLFHGELIGKDIRCYLFPDVLASHVEFIIGFMESEPFKAAANAQKLYVGKEGEPPARGEIKTVEEFDSSLSEMEAYESRALSHVFADLHSGLEKYLASLQG